MGDLWDRMAEAEKLRDQWRAAVDEYENAKQDGTPAPDVDAAFEKMERLKGAYLAKAKKVLSVDSNED